MGEKREGGQGGGREGAREGNKINDPILNSVTIDTVDAGTDKNNVTGNYIGTRYLASVWMTNMFLILIFFPPYFCFFFCLLFFAGLMTRLRWC